LRWYQNYKDNHIQIYGYINFIDTNIIDNKIEEIKHAKPYKVKEINNEKNTGN
jgi:hypothetical protein